MIRTFPRAFTSPLGCAGKRWIQAVEVPVQIAEVAVDNMATAHGRLIATVAEDDVVLGIPDPQRIHGHIVAITRPDASIRGRVSKRVKAGLTWPWIGWPVPHTRRPHQ